MHLLKASHVLSVNRNKCLVSVDTNWFLLEFAVDVDKEAIFYLSHAVLSSRMSLTSLPPFSSTTSFLSFKSFPSLLNCSHPEPSISSVSGLSLRVEHTVNGNGAWYLPTKLKACSWVQMRASSLISVTNLRKEQ